MKVSLWSYAVVVTLRLSLQVPRQGHHPQFYPDFGRLIFVTTCTNTALHASDRRVDHRGSRGFRVGVVCGCASLKLHRCGHSKLCPES